MSLRLESAQGYLLSLFLFNITLENLDSEIIQEKEKQGIQIGKEGIKWSLFTDEMIAYIENLPETTKLLELIRDYYSKFAGYS